MANPKRYTSDELRVFKEEAEERARRLVHGESICQAMENTQRTIVTFFRRYAPWDISELRGDEYLVGVQAIPLRLIVVQFIERTFGSHPGVAIREALLKTGEADYLLFASGKAIASVEA
jgi:hypothetical protein